MGDLYVGIVVLEVDDFKFDEVYNFEVVVLIDMYYYIYSVSNSSELLWMDSDLSVVLLVMCDLMNDLKQFQKVMKVELLYFFYVENEVWNYIGGFRVFVCGLKNNVQILVNGKGDGMLNQLC